MCETRPTHPASADVEAVVTSFNQRDMISEAVHSLCMQTLPPGRILIVDDGSTDLESRQVLAQLQADPSLPVPVCVIYKENGGVSSARNAGLQRTKAPFVVMLDGDDYLEPSYVERVSALLCSQPRMVAASSWLHTFGVLDALVRPCGGSLAPFLSRNCCPATHILRRSAYVQCGGYDETMRSGFEDWDFFLSLLETAPEAQIGIVEAPLINYRTNPVSSNVKSMEKRLELMNFIIEKHIRSYRTHVAAALLGLEAVSCARLQGWEDEMLHGMAVRGELGEASRLFLQSPSYGDGGMASAVRIASANGKMPSDAPLQNQ